MKYVRGVSLVLCFLIAGFLNSLIGFDEASAQATAKTDVSRSSASQAGAPVAKAAPESASPEQPGTMESKPEYKDWQTDVLMPVIRDVSPPLIRFAVIVLLFGLLFYFMDLKSVMRRDVWSERTIVAFAIIFTYCAAALMGADDILGFLKDVTLVVIGFYFGSAKGGREEQAPAKKENTPPAKSADPNKSDHQPTH